MHSLNLKSLDVASGQVGENDVLSICEHDDSFPCNTLDNILLLDDKVLNVSFQAWVDPKDDQIEISCKIYICSPCVSTYSLNKVPFTWDKSIYTLVDPCENKGESLLTCEFLTTS